MDKVAALSNMERKELFESTAQSMGVHPAIAEKDFWVCWVLKKLFNSELKSHLVFKGGTSLSKVHGLIDRFSEDIDLVLNWNLLGYDEHSQNPWQVQNSNTQQHKFNQKFNDKAQTYLEKTLQPYLAKLLVSCPDARSFVSSDEAQVINVAYPAAFSLDALRPQVKLEIGPLAAWVPSDHHRIKPYAAQYFPAVFENPECEVIAITAERTFWGESYNSSPTSQSNNTDSPGLFASLFRHVLLSHQQGKRESLSGSALA